jgi:adenylyl- and sulfurtransferase ThiI
MGESLKEAVVLVSSAEFALKSSPVRRSMEQRLIDDLKFAMLKGGFDSVKIQKDAGRIVIRGINEPTKAAALCSKVFGVAYAAPAARVNSLPESIKQTIVQLAKHELLPGQSFAIRCHRSSPSTTSTRDVEVDGGAEVLKVLHEREVRVKLNHPDRTIFADLCGQSAYVYSTKIPGPGGLPISSQWKMLAVLDSGPLSLFAAYVMMRRGCLVQLLIPNIRHAQTSLDQQLTLARKLRGLVTRERYNAFVISIDSELRNHRLLIRLISLDIAKQNRFRAIIFPDVAGPISHSMILAEKSREAGLPIFQPLLGFNQNELDELCGIFNIDMAEVNSELVREKYQLDETSITDLPNISLEEVSL